MLTKLNTLPTPQAVGHSWPQASLLPLRPVHYKRSAAPSSIIRSALCSPFLSPYWMNRPGNEGPLCPPCLSCVPWCSGAQLDKSQIASALFAHYSHYAASNQCRTGCWDLSTTHKVLGSLVLLPVRDPATKSVCRGRGRQISAPVSVAWYEYGFSGTQQLPPHRPGTVQLKSSLERDDIPVLKCSCWTASLFKRVTKTQESSKMAKTNKPKCLFYAWVVWQVLKATVALRRFKPNERANCVNFWTVWPQPKEGLPILLTTTDQTAFKSE